MSNGWDGFERATAMIAMRAMIENERWFGD
jgi:hypothetical protein